MPERDKAVERAAALIVGADSRTWDAIIRRPAGMRKAEWQALTVLVDMLYAYTVRHIDWNRVMVTANSRHIALIEAEEKGGEAHERSELISFVITDERQADDGLCPECLREALLQETTMGSLQSEWQARPTARLQADWWHEWLNVEGPGARATLEKLAPIILEAADRVTTTDPDEDEEDA